MRKTVLFTCLLLGLGWSSLIARAAESADDMLSKADATLVFSQSFEAWKSQTEMAKAAGVAHAAAASDYEITLYMRTSLGVLAVTPTYVASDLAKPRRIAVSALQSPAASLISKTVSDAGLKDIIAKVQQQMLPEFTVLMKVDLTGKEVQFDHFIFEAGVHPMLDEMAVQKKGCWEQCITR